MLLSRAVPALLLLLVLTGCPSGYVQTESGATVAASTVYAQDLVGDALKTLQDVHNAAVEAHDAKGKAQAAAVKAGDPIAIAGDAEFQKVHAKRRATLQASAAGLRSGWDGLSAWKAGTEGGGIGAVAAKVRDALPGLLTVAVELRVIPQGTADAIATFFGTAVQGKTPAKLKKETIVSILVPAQEIDWRAAVQPVHRNSTVIQLGAYFDGCNWHTPHGNGVWSSTAMHCGTVNASDMYVRSPR